MKPIKILTILILIITTLLSSCIDEKEPDYKEHVKKGDQIPSFTTVEGPYGKYSSDQMSGKRGIIFFFSTSCGQCQRLFPEIYKLWLAIERGETVDVEFCAINRAEDPSAVAEYMGSRYSHMPYYLDPDRSIFNSFASGGVPRMYLVGRDGKVHYISIENERLTANTIIEELANIP